MVGLRVLALVSALGPLLANALSYALPHSLVALDNCYYPANFTISEFDGWTPAENNTAHKQTLQFTFQDQGSGITTRCQMNSTSVPVNGNSTGVAPRYPCDDSPYVDFIWQNNKLTMIEAVCPQTSGWVFLLQTCYPCGGRYADKTRRGTFQASGSALPNTTCTPTAASYGDGVGLRCIMSGLLHANFTSLQPAPPARFVQWDVRGLISDCVWDRSLHGKWNDTASGVQSPAFRAGHFGPWLCSSSRPRGPEWGILMVVSKWLWRNSVLIN